MGTDPQQRMEQRRQRTARAFKRALDDPQFREQFVSNTSRTQVDAAGNRQTAELPADAREKRRELLTAVLDRAASDQQFREQLTTNPQRAILDGGFRPQVEQLRAELPQPEVRGYAWYDTFTSGTGWTLWSDPFGGTSGDW